MAFHKKYIKKEEFEKIEVGDKLITRFMGKCTVRKLLPDIKEVKVKFIEGPWKDRELTLIRQQIAHVNVPWF